MWRWSCVLQNFFFFKFFLSVTRVVEFTKARENHLLLISRLSYLCKGFEELYCPRVMSAGDGEGVEGVVENT